MALSKAERSYIQTSLLSSPALRGDGRSLAAYRSISLETGVAPLANGSARLSIGRGTEVLAATKLEVEDIETGEGVDGGRVVCTVICSPAAYPQLTSSTLDELQYDLTIALNETLSHPSLHPKNLGIIPGKKAWLLSLDIVVLGDAGNIWDALFMGARAALWDTKVPRTRAVEYKAVLGYTANEGNMEVDSETVSGFDTRHVQRATDFELPDYWDEGEVLAGRERWPISVTMNIVDSVHFLDATAEEEESAPMKLLLAFSFPSGSKPELQAMRLVGPGELELSQLKALIKDGENYGRGIFNALNAKLQAEDVRRNEKAREKFARR